MPKRETALEVINLTRAFGGLRALVDVTMQVRDEEIVGVIGPNGAGKTTLVNLVSGFLIPDQGSILFRGTPIHSLPPHLINRLGIARTFQQIRLFGHMTVLENCLAGMHVRFESRLGHIVSRSHKFRCEVEERITEARALLNEFDLLKLELRTAGTLPYGEQRRLEIVRALGSHPTLLCLDEPAAGMNEKESHDLSDAIRALPPRGTSVMLIEHDMRVVRGLTDRVVVLNEGSVIATGPADEVLRHPEVIRAYIGGHDA